KPVRLMKPTLMPRIKDLCREFVSNTSSRNYYNRPEKLIHNGTWKESEKEITYVVKEIFGVLEDFWNNPALDSEISKSLNEGTYQSTVIVPVIRAVLRNLPFRTPSFITTSEKQSIASADRKGDGKMGRRPDIMLAMSPQKKIDDEIKLWRETNNGLYWTRKTLNPDKDQFGIVGVQIAGDTLHLNVLVRDKVNIHKIIIFNRLKFLCEYQMKM
ncbi:1030_t:CDS:2, partial [Acaulospora morrowiae]